MSFCVTRGHVFLCHNKTPNSKTHHFYTISDRLFPELFGDPFLQKRTTFIPCVLGPTEFTFLPLWGLEAVGGHRDHKSVSRLPKCQQITFRYFKKNNNVPQKFQKCHFSKLRKIQRTKVQMSRATKQPEQKLSEGPDHD